MLLPLIAVVVGLALLIWSADRFVAGASAVAYHAGMSPLLIGMVIVGFGTSAPEMVVSAFSAAQGNPGLALGNAYGSNITNIALILGAAALIRPMAVPAHVLKRELAVLCLVTLLAAFQLWDGFLSRADAWVLLAVFAFLMLWAILPVLSQSRRRLVQEVQKEIQISHMPLRQALLYLTIGIVVLAGSSRLLVWGAVRIAEGFGISDLIIGLTIVAVGTSLPELASSVMAARHGEHDIALGNVLGSNLFNTLAVVGIAGAIHPLEVAPEVLTRDCLVMGVLTFSLIFLGHGRKSPGQIGRGKGVLLLAAYLAYNGLLIWSVLRG
ncbi:MAG: calcium/sodium antiporter [Desulfuromonadaceae bacterium]|nr:calcium/sodium antiporter [Desulfuromonadaceae bacterium]